MNPYGNVWEGIPCLDTRAVGSLVGEGSAGPQAPGFLPYSHISWGLFPPAGPSPHLAHGHLWSSPMLEQGEDTSGSCCAPVKVGMSI